MKRPSLAIAGGTDTARIVKIPRSLRFEEILEIKAPDTLIKNRLPARGLVFIYGPPKSGKTFFALDMCLSLARGEPWHGTPVKQAGVLYVAGEGVHGLGMRILAYVRKHGHKPRSRFRAIPAAITLHESVAALEEEMRSIEIEEGWRPEVLVLDTLARTKGDLDENSGEMAAYISAADHFIARGMLVIVIHHPGKDAEKGVRGWSGLLGALDLQIQVLRQGDTIVARWTHAKDLPDVEPLPFRLVATGTGEIDGWGEPVTSCTLEPADSMPAPRAKVTGANQQLLFRLAGDVARAAGEKGEMRNGRPVFREDALFDAWAAAKEASGNKKQAARSYFVKPLQSLIEAGALLRDAGSGMLFFP
jgi:hypothetical protein